LPSPLRRGLLSSWWASDQMFSPLTHLMLQLLPFSWHALRLPQMALRFRTVRR